MKEVDFSTFGIEVLEESYYRMVIVDFWAPWCNPCHALIKTLEKIESEEDFPFKYVKANVDENTDVAVHFKVMGVPNVRFFAGGRETGSFSENMVYPKIKAVIQSNYIHATLLKQLKPDETLVAHYVEGLEQYWTGTAEKDFKIFIPLIKYFLVTKPERSKYYMKELEKDHEYLEHFLYLKDLVSLLELPFEDLPVHKKLWAARNSLARSDFDATYQFLFQAYKIEPEYLDQFPKQAILAFRHFLNFHPLNDKYAERVDRLL